MKIEVWTWGTGGPFGRELGVGPNRRRRGHTATSIVIPDGAAGGAAGAHILVDVGAPSVERMIEAGVSPPDLVFLTHSHFDHLSDLDRLANSRMRGLMVRAGVKDFERALKLFGPLPVIGTEDCLHHPEDGVRARFGYLGGLVSWRPLSGYDVWQRVRRPDGALSPEGSQRDGLSLAGAPRRSGGAIEGASPERSGLPHTGGFFPFEVKALPVHHSKHAPGSCLFLFRLSLGYVGSPGGDGPRFRNFVVSGDYKSMEEWVIESPDLRDPACLVLDTNTIKASGDYHASLEENRSLIDRWTSGEEEVLVLLNHLSGFGDFRKGFYDHVPDDEDWRAAAGFATKPKVTVKIAEDGECHRI